MLRAIPCLLVVGILVPAGCDAVIPTPVQTGGNYSPVTAADLVGSKSSHRTGKEKFDFVWAFEKYRFVIEGSNLPPDLVESMLGADAKATKIEGAWEIHSDETIHFFVETDQPDGMPRESSLKIFFTGIIRIATDTAQYGF